MSKPVKQYHYFCLSFVTQFPGGSQFSSHYMRGDQQNISLPDIIGFRHDGKIPETAVLLGMSYLGYMTEEQFSPSQGLPPKAPKSYLEGIEAGLYTEDPIPNLYEPESADSLQFLAGVEAGREMRNKKVTS